ncbi:unnamed protein product [Boreogadus saida]
MSANSAAVIESRGEECKERSGKRMCRRCPRLMDARGATLRVRGNRPMLQARERGPDKGRRPPRMEAEDSGCQACHWAQS